MVEQAHKTNEHSEGTRVLSIPPGSRPGPLGHTCGERLRDRGFPVYKYSLISIFEVGCKLLQGHIGDSVVRFEALEEAIVRHRVERRRQIKEGQKSYLLIIHISQDPIGDLEQGSFTAMLLSVSRLVGFF